MSFTDLLQQHLPPVISWIRSTLEHHSPDKIPLVTTGHARLLSGYFPSSFLERSYVIYTDEIPSVPLYATGIPELISMNQMPAAGITYLDTFFILQTEKHDPSIHFHELIHVIQWEYLGMERFLLCYGHGLLTSGYRSSPLEKMAYDLQHRFGNGEIFDAVSTVNEMMKPLALLAEQLVKKN